MPFMYSLSLLPGSICCCLTKYITLKLHLSKFITASTCPARHETIRRYVQDSTDSRILHASRRFSRNVTSPGRIIKSETVQRRPYIEYGSDE